ncbi:trimeric autotransporter adhesin AtaA-like [Montipora foliosa]|uniref:trimeric autotransporter adhesin AtaA-like n=1 Tax=Montipora foliosa TaxID=591990 RepID=UPI0035F11608
MTSLLDMGNEPIRNVGPGRHNTTDALTHLQLEAFYVDLNTNTGNIEAQNPIDMQDQKITGIKDGTNDKDAVNKKQVLLLDGTQPMQANIQMGNFRVENMNDPRINSKDAMNMQHFNREYFDLAANKAIDCRGNRLYNLGSYTNNDQLITGLVTEARYLRKDNATIDMHSKRVINVTNPTGNTDAVNKQYLETHTTNLRLGDYVKRDGTVSVTGDFEFGDNKITKVGNGTQSTDLVNKGYIDTALAAKPNVNQVVLRNGTQEMLADLNLSLNKIINCGQPTGTRDVTNKAYVDFEVGKKTDINQVVLRDGSNTMTSNLDMNNQRIINLGNATHNQDAITLKQVNDAFSTVSTNNNKYTDQKITESHISTRENRKNVLAYAMDNGEFTEDFAIQDVNLITYNDAS